MNVKVYMLILYQWTTKNLRVEAYVAWLVEHFNFNAAGFRFIFSS